MKLMFESYQSVATLEEAFATKEDFLIIPKNPLSSVPDIILRTKRYLIENRHRSGLPFLEFLLESDWEELIGIYYQPVFNSRDTKKNPDYRIRTISSDSYLYKVMLGASFVYFL